MIDLLFPVFKVLMNLGVSFKHFILKIKYFTILRYGWKYQGVDMLPELK